MVPKQIPEETVTLLRVEVKEEKSPKEVKGVMDLERGLLSK